MAGTAELWKTKKSYQCHLCINVQRQQRLGLLPFNDVGVSCAWVCWHCQFHNHRQCRRQVVVMCGISVHAPRMQCCRANASTWRWHCLLHAPQTRRNCHHHWLASGVSASVFCFWPAWLVWHLQHAQSPTLPLIQTEHCNSTATTAVHHVPAYTTTTTLTTTSTFVVFTSLAFSLGQWNFWDSWSKFLQLHAWMKHSDKNSALIQYGTQIHGSLFQNCAKKQPMWIISAFILWGSSL